MSLYIPEETPPMALDFSVIWQRCEWLTPKEFGLAMALLGLVWGAPGFRVRGEDEEVQTLFSNGVAPEFRFEDYEIKNALAALFWFHPREGYIYSPYILQLVGRPSKRQPIPGWMKAIAIRDASPSGVIICEYCMARPLSVDEIHFDHRLPISRGGINHPDNLAVCCASCNLSKGAMTGEEFLERINASYQEDEAP